MHTPQIIVRQRSFSPTDVFPYERKIQTVERKISNSFKILLTFKKSLFIFLLLESKIIHMSEKKVFLVSVKTYRQQKFIFLYIGIAESNIK